MLCWQVAYKMLEAQQAALTHASSTGGEIGPPEEVSVGRDSFSVQENEEVSRELLI